MFIEVEILAKMPLLSRIKQTVNYRKNILKGKLWEVDEKDKLKYYATFKVRKFEWLFYKINTFLQKTTT